MSSNVADLDHTAHLFALAMIPRVRIPTRVADDTKTSGHHATASTVRANDAVASVASKHSLKGIGGSGLHSVELINVALEGLTVLQGHQRVGARRFVDGFGVSLDRAARSSTQLAVAFVGVVAVELLGVPLVDVVRMTTATDLAAQLQRRQAPSFAGWLDGSVDGDRRKRADGNLTQLQRIDVSGVMLRDPLFSVSELERKFTLGVFV